MPRLEAAGREQWPHFLLRHSQLWDHRKLCLLWTCNSVLGSCEYTYLYTNKTACVNNVQLNYLFWHSKWHVISRDQGGHFEINDGIKENKLIAGLDCVKRRAWWWLSTVRSVSDGHHVRCCKYGTVLNPSRPSDAKCVSKLGVGGSTQLQCIYYLVLYTDL